MRLVHVATRQAVLEGDQVLLDRKIPCKIYYLGKKVVSIQIAATDQVVMVQPTRIATIFEGEEGQVLLDLPRITPERHESPKFVPVKQAPRILHKA